jgi:chemotaxis protein MotB
VAEAPTPAAPADAPASEDPKLAADTTAEASAGAPPPEESAEPLAPIIVKKIIDEGHGGAHGGAWKIALADMMTAMMAFFLLMWLLGATNTDQRKSIADYFKPTALTRSAITVNSTSGSQGLLGGQSIIDDQALPNPAAQTGLMQILTPRDDTGSKSTEKSGDKDQDKAKDKDKNGADNLTEEEKQEIAQKQDQKNFEKLEKELEEKLSEDKSLQKLKEQVIFVREKEGLRIEIIDKADFSMFPSGTSLPSGKAEKLMAEISKSLASMPNKIKVRGHTDSVIFNNKGRNNWSLSAERAEAIRQVMAKTGIDEKRWSRIEGVADTEHFNPANPTDPRNRRISITLLYQNADGGKQYGAGGEKSK